MSDHSTAVTYYCDRLEVPAICPSSEDACPICLDAYTPYTLPAVVKTCCQHIFHYACLHTWLSDRNPSCPMCREVLLTSPTAPIAIAVPHISEHSEDGSFFEDPSNVLIWGEDADSYPYESVLNAAHESWIEENRVLRMLENNGRIQRQRLLLMEELSALAQEDEELTHAEIQYHRRICGGESEAADERRQARLDSLRRLQEELLPDFWDLDASLQELIVEERQLRHTVYLESVLEIPL
jgi:hypothetical protein